MPKADDAAPPATTKPQGWRQRLPPAIDRVGRAFKSDWTPRVLYTLLLWTVTGGLIRGLDGKLTTTAGHPLLEYIAGALSPALLLFVLVAQALTFFLVGLFGLMYSQPTGRVSKEALIDGVRQYYTFGVSAFSLAAWYGHWGSSLVFLFFGVFAPWTVLAGNDTRKQN